jgi:hypothetical protein
LEQDAALVEEFRRFRAEVEELLKIEKEGKPK